MDCDSISLRGGGRRKRDIALLGTGERQGSLEENRYWIAHPRTNVLVVHRIRDLMC